ncbi:hypothetical protein BC835DRAFT_1290945 [Cytidiella melzeri]|nr:hypothetical protein BC835DRAFT_1290945 [Cytidiella melzeri]
MCRETNEAGFDLTLIPSTAAVQAYNPSLGRAVTAAEWHVDLNGTPRSPWNKSCWRVFYFSFLDVGYGFTSRDEHEIETAYFNHLRYLQNLCKSLSADQQTLSTRRIEHNRSERRRTVRVKTSFLLLRRRIGAALEDADTAPHAPMLSWLGTDGMSSNESDVENGARIFRIKTLPWRNPDLILWLLGFNALHRKARYGPVDPRTRGAPPHERIDSGLVSSSRRAPPGLPENAYDNTFLRYLPSWSRQDLSASSRYNFSHKPRVQQ